MVLVLLIGDLCIPQRSVDLPPAFKKLLVPGKIQQILCTGNLVTKQTHEYLRSISSDLVCISGEFDDFAYPAFKILRIQNLRVLLMHGHQLLPWASPEAMNALARQYDVDVVVTGFTGPVPGKSLSEEKFNDGRMSGVHVYEMDGRFFICPGSATGIYHGSLPLGKDETADCLRPSFILLDVQGSMITAYIYQLANGEVKVEKVEYAKR